MKFSISRQYNREPLFPEVDTEGLEYFELQDIFDNPDTIWLVEAVYINTKGLYDDRPVLVVSGIDGREFRGYVNLPSHLTKTCQAILEDRNAIEAIKNGAVGFTIYTYNARNYNNKTCYSIRWVDI